jgi:outer membrane protein TolC
MLHRFATAAACLLAAACLAHADAQETLPIAPLIEEALARNPKILAARERHAALAEKVSPAGALADPMLSLGVASLPTTFDFSAEDMTTKEVALSQKLPFPGKLELNAEMARREAEAGGAGAEEVANQVVKAVRDAYHDLSHVYRSLEVTRRSQTLLEELAHLSRTRYALGQGIQEEVVRSQVEISKMVDDRILLEQKKRALAARMNFLLGRPPGSPVGRPEDPAFVRRELSIEELQQRAARESPVLRGLKQEVAARRTGVALARKDYLPDFGLRFAYGQRESRPDMLSGMIEVNLPIFAGSRQGPRVAETLAEARSAEARYDDAFNELMFMIAELGAMAQRLERRIELYRTGILPQARMQIDAATSAYTVGQADFTALLDSRMRLYRFELEYHEALTEYEKTLAALEAAVGVRFTQGEGP